MDGYNPAAASTSSVALPEDSNIPRQASSARLASGMQNQPEHKDAAAIDEHLLSVEQVCQRYGSSIDSAKPANSRGLNDEVAAARLVEYGPNILSPPKRKHPVLKYLECLSDIFNLLLLLAGILTFILVAIERNVNSPNIYIAPILVGVSLINAFIEFYQLQKSAAILESFLNLIPAKCNALRGSLKQLSAKDLVPGDVVFVRMGDKLPADIVIFSCSDFKVDNSSLTGESEPQERTAKNTQKNPLEATNLAFNGTLAVSGECYGIVIRTGDNTLIGQIAGMTAGETKRKSPMSEEIERFVRIIGTVAILSAIIFFIVAAVTYKDIGKALTFAIGVLVAWVPQGLPATVTLLLTIAAKRMATQKVLVKDLQGVETLGAITLLATDKTGTLTRNQMTVANVWTHFKRFSVVTDQRSIADEEVPFDSSVKGIQLVMMISAMCSRARFDRTDVPLDQRQILGDATETGLYRLSAQKLKDFEKLNDMFPKMVELPFNSDTKWHLSIHRKPHANGTYVVFMKGAPERVLRICATILNGEGEAIPLTDEHKAQFTDSYECMAEKGHRVLAFAFLELNGNNFPDGYVFNKEEKNFPMNDLTFVGLASLEDPPKHGVREAIGYCRRAGIKVVMVTGDHPLTAEAIGRKINLMISDTKARMSKRSGRPMEEIDESEVKAIVIHGEEIDSLTEEDWDIIFSKDEIIFARTSPKHKLQIVKRAQSIGHIVGVTGDGVNDSPALKKADLGIAMNVSGSDVSKEAAAMILLDDNFASTVNGIREGRLIFTNLKKAIQYVLTHSIPEVLPQLLYIIVPLPLALNALQILVIDLGFELLAALSYAWELPESEGLMKLPPRKPVTNDSVEKLRAKRDWERQFISQNDEENHQDMDRPLTWAETFRQVRTRQYWKYKFMDSNDGEILVDAGLLSWSYLEGGMIEFIGSMTTFFVTMYLFEDWGFTPGDAMRCQSSGGFIENGSACLLSNGKLMPIEKQNELLSHGQSAFYLSVMIMQMWNLFACKCRMSLPFGRYVLRNKMTWVSIAGGVGFAALIVFVPPFNIPFNTNYRLNLLLLLIPFGFGFLLLLYSALRHIIYLKLHPISFTPEPLGLQMHPTKWSRSSRNK